MRLTKSQRAVLELAASRTDGEVTRWDVDGARIKALYDLEQLGHLWKTASGFRITDAGRKALES